MTFLNPYSKTVTEMAKQAHEAGRKKALEALNAKRGISKSLTKDQKTDLKKRKKASRGWITGVMKNVDESYARDAEALRQDDLLAQ